MKAVSALDADGVNADLDAAADYAKTIPAGDGKVASIGFCWGGGKSFAFAAHRKDLSAAFVFYGPGPADVTSITAPVYGFYAGDDSRIVAARDRAMTRLLKLLGDLKSTPKAANSGANPIMRGKKITAAAACHPAGNPAAM